MDKRAVIIMGSASDMQHAQKIVDALASMHIDSVTHVASAHKQPLEVLRLIAEYDRTAAVVYITIAGRSNALSGFVAANSRFPTIACPPFADKTDMLVNNHSTLQMPANVPVMTVLEPANTALAVKRIFDLLPGGSEPCAE